MKHCRIILPAIFLSLFYMAVSAQDTIVDGIVAIVGGHIILKSDVENQYIQFRAQGSITGSSRRVKCQIIENLLFQKLVYQQA